MKSVEKADKADCDNVYTYAVTLQVKELAKNEQYNARELNALAWEVEQEFEHKGAKDKFLRSCQATMTKQQVECALQVSDVAEMHSCVTLIK